MTRTSSEDPAGTYRAALRVGEFDAVAGAGLISILGDSAAYLAVTVLVFQRTGSALLAALTFTIAFMPYLLGGTLLAALVDRVRPKTLLIGIDLAGAALLTVAATGGVPIPVLYAAIFAVGALAPIRSGTAAALIAEVLPGDTFLAGRSLQRICSQTGQIVGTGLGGALVGAFGPRGALLADVASFLLSATVTAVGVRARPVAGRTGTERTGTERTNSSLIAASLAAVREVWSHQPVRRLLLLGWVVPFVAVAPEGLGAPAVAQSGHSAALVGVWMAAIPIGTVAGDLIVMWTVPPPQRRHLTWAPAIVLTVLLITFGTGPPLGVALALLVATGAASVCGLGLDQALRDRTEPGLRARTYTLFSTGLMVTQGLGFATAGALGQILSADDTVAVAGSAGLVAVLTLAWNSHRADAAPPSR